MKQYTSNTVNTSQSFKCSCFSFFGGCHVYSIPSHHRPAGSIQFHVRSLGDGTEGWLSIKGNQGSLFLKEVEKPFYSISSRDEANFLLDVPSEFFESFFVLILFLFFQHVCFWTQNFLNLRNHKGIHHWKVRCGWMLTSKWVVPQPPPCACWSTARWDGDFFSISFLQVLHIFF